MTDYATQINAAARRADAMADRAREAATRVEAAGQIRWEGKGFEAYRDRLRERARGFRAAASDLDTLADRLRSHARHVEHNQRLLDAATDIAIVGVRAVW